MNIYAYNKTGQKQSMEYVMTYGYGAPQRSRKIVFPLQLSQTNAEAMLHAIGLLAQKKEVKTLLDEWAYAFRENADLLCLVNDPVSEFKNVTIPWGEIDYFLHFHDSIAVDHGPWQFHFPDECSFNKMYKEAFDEGLYQQEEFGAGLPVEQYHIIAANDIPAILSSYTTVFVRSEEYKQLCRKLKAYFQLIEETLQEKLFDFRDEVEPYEIYLVSMFREEATLYGEESFYPDNMSLVPGEHRFI